MYKIFGKKLTDIVFGLAIVLLTFPLFVIACIVLFVQNRGSVFFVQDRPGFHEKGFRIIKFKTMSDACDEGGHLLPDIQRITSAGKLLRKLSLDELPQLLNVLKGEMSLIGPRPLLFKYIPLYTSEQRRRHTVRPGITGWAQVNGRNAISWTKRFELDSYYVDHLSFALDAKIFYLTIIRILKREGINQSDARPMEPFTGKN